MISSGFVFVQCGDDACRLRFPVEVAVVESRVVCPRCRGPVAVIAAVAPLPTVARSLLPPVDGATSVRLVALLDNIRSIHNIGSMFRTADGAGLDHLHLAGISATPEHPRLAKAALGAHLTMPWTYHRNSLDAAARLRDEGFCLWALERTAEASLQPSLYDAGPPDAPLALVVGNERAGVDPDLLALCDGVFSLPMRGGKSSLNVAVAFGIAVYHLRFAAAPVAAR